MLKLAIPTLFLIWLFWSAQSSPALPYEIVEKNITEATSAILGPDGSVAIFDSYGEGNKFKLKEPSKPLRALPVVADEELRFVGIKTSGEIVAESIVRTTVDGIFAERINLILVNPKTGTRRTVELSPEEYDYLSSAGVVLMNPAGLVAIVNDSKREAKEYRVTFLDDALNKHGFKFTSSVNLYGDSLSYLTQAGELILSGMKNQKHSAIKVSQQGTVTELGSKLFGSGIPIDVGFGTYPTDLLLMGTDERFGSEPLHQRVRVALLDLTTNDLKKWSFNFPRRKFPTFENEVRAYKPKLDSAGNLYLGTLSSGYSDGFYLGGSVIQVSPKGTERHLNCYISPELGHINGDTSLLSLNTNGQGLAIIERNARSKKNLVLIKSLDTSSERNYCLGVRATLSKECSGYFSTSSFRSEGVLSLKRYEIAPRNCNLTLSFVDSKGEAVVGENVIARTDAGEISKKLKVNKRGTVTFKLHDFVGKKDICGWTINLENEKKYQPNGIAIFNDYACRRI